MNSKKLINSVLSDFSYYDTKIYTDEPIIKTASQLSCYLPVEYKKMKRLAFANNKSAQQIFFEQASLMHGFVDDYPTVKDFNCYYPTYSSMNDNQLRTYFSWRSEVRRGVASEISLSYVYVYIYELLMTIGCSSPVSAFCHIKNFWKAYRIIDTRLDAYIPLWLKDMVIYYNLDKALLNDIYDSKTDDSLCNVIYNTKDDELFYESILYLSSYKTDTSSFVKKYQKDYFNVTVKVFRELYNFYEKRRENGFSEKLFGRIVSCPYNIFSSAVFYDHLKYNDYSFSINLVHSYKCINGKWFCERYYGNVKNNKVIGEILKYIDCKMREIFHYRYPLNYENSKCNNKKLIDRIIVEYYEEKLKVERPEVIIDFSKLNEIRASADNTRERLIVEEAEFDVVPFVLPEKENESLLSANEIQFIYLLINGENYISFLKEESIMLNIIVDSINEKLFNEFSDTVIIFNEDKPEIIEDYLDDLKGML